MADDGAAEERKYMMSVPEAFLIQFFRDLKRAGLKVLEHEEEHEGEAHKGKRTRTYRVELPGEHGRAKHPMSLEPDWLLFDFRVADPRFTKEELPYYSSFSWIRDAQEYA